MIHEKLVRDLIPQLIEEGGDEAITQVLSEDELRSALRDKLKTCIDDYLESEDTEELADMLEIIRTLVQFHAISYDELEELREKKLEEYGSYDARLYLIETIEN